MSALPPAGAVESEVVTIGDLQNRIGSSSRSRTLDYLRAWRTVCELLRMAEVVHEVGERYGLQCSLRGVEMELTEK